MKFLEDSARGLDVHAIHLEVMRPNTGARRFYLRAGYEDHDSHFMTKWLIDKPSVTAPRIRDGGPGEA